MPHGRLVTGAEWECECLARMCLARPLARNEGLGRGGRPALISPHTSLTHTSMCTVLHLVVFGESTLVSTMAATSLRSESMQSAAAARSQRCTRLTILLDRHAAHVGGAASCALQGRGQRRACLAMSARSQTPGCNLKGIRHAARLGRTTPLPLPPHTHTSLQHYLV